MLRWRIYIAKLYNHIRPFSFYYDFSGALGSSEGLLAMEKNAFLLNTKDNTGKIPKCFIKVQRYWVALCSENISRKTRSV